MKKLTTILLLILTGLSLWSQDILLEAETFDNKGGWQVDPQFVEQMGSPYLLAHGMGIPVADASTQIHIQSSKNYHVWVRTMNWAPGEWKAPGRFLLQIDDDVISHEFGQQTGWSWEYAGKYKLKSGQHKVTLKDLTGFEGRCDAIFFSLTQEAPPSEKEQLKEWRAEKHAENQVPDIIKQYDFVVVGGGLAGCAAAIAAAETGLKVALVHDRPVTGGNASGEIRVHTLGIYGYFERIIKMLDTEHYPNGDPKAHDEDKKRMENLQRYSNIDLYLNWRAYDSPSQEDHITCIDARNTLTNERIRFRAHVYADCTGDGWIGYWSGAEYMYGRESYLEYDEAWEKHGELWSPEKPDNFVMGSSILWRTYETDSVYTFPEVPWAMPVVKDYAAKHGEWQWEFSQNDLNQTDDAEYIRDHMFKAIYGSFYNYKQHYQSDSLALEWVSYLLGKRESRRLKGDYIYTFNDAKNGIKFEDAVVSERREIDVHYQQYLTNPDAPNFLSQALFYKTDTYFIPYRSLYSVNIKNLLMAGRCFSCSHVGLGGPRVMRTTGQMGAAIGYAAYLCNKYTISPREVYEHHLDEYLKLVKYSDNYKPNSTNK